MLKKYFLNDGAIVKTEVLTSFLYDGVLAVKTRVGPGNDENAEVIQ